MVPACEEIGSARTESRGTEISYPVPSSGESQSDGRRIGVIRWPEQAVNFAFGGPDLRTLFCCARTLVYALRVKVPGNSHPWYKRRGQ